MLLAALLGGAIGGAPYLDPKGRFTVEVPERFALSPRFGETRGARWTQEDLRRGESPVTFEILVRPVHACSSGQGARLGDGRAWRREALPEGERWALTTTRSCLEVRWVGSHRARTREKRALRAMLETLQEGPKAASRSLAARGPSPPQPTVGALDLTGQWQDVQGHQLRLDSQGNFRLGALEGQWRWEEGTLVLMGKSGPRRFGVQRSKDALILSGGGLEEPLRFTRPREDTPRPTLGGSWSGPGFELRLHPAGHFSLGDMKGEWAMDGQQLVLRQGPNEVRYRWRRSGARLVLSGADLDAPITLLRVGEPNSAR
ncbi:MAG: hypothetical protein AAFU79_15260 [Myxococcota bacterium]